jgi:hypothetical protein
LDKPVRPAPDAAVILCTVRPVPFTAAAPTLAAPDAAEALAFAAWREAVKNRRARLGRSSVPVSPMAPVFCLCGVGDTAEALASLLIYGITRHPRGQIGNNYQT